MQNKSQMLHKKGYSCVKETTMLSFTMQQTMAKVHIPEFSGIYFRQVLGEDL